ncbi:MAG: hypothetical protein LBI61_04000 [Puniceicoccales bacterium]|nr:hypothetical protein [Puniceicoccales bacterium]
MILALSIVVVVVFLGGKLVNVSAENAKSMEEARGVDCALHALLKGMRTDFESVVMLDKNQPIFEICARDDGKGIAIFCFATVADNGEPSVTRALCYDVLQLGAGKVEVSRILLDATTTLSLQGALANGSSFKKFFDGADQSCKQVRKFDTVLSDFKIRAAVKKRNGKIFMTASNERMIFFGGALAYQKSGKSLTVPGELIFLDVTLRAFQGRDAQKFDAVASKDRAKAKDFLFANSRKSFGRISFNGTNF